jgi:hypothetical protein
VQQIEICLARLSGASAELKMPAQIHPVFSHPPRQNAKIWRYMDFTKFVSMLEHKGLYLSRADQLGDPFEGSIPKANHAFYQQMFAQINHFPPDRISEITDRRSEIGKNTRREIYVNCWHMNEGESAAMWNLYSKSNEVIALQASFMNLFNCIDSSENDQFYVGCIHYVDYETGAIPQGNFFYPFVHKRLSFQHENEVRIIHLLPSNFPGNVLDRETPIGIWKLLPLEKLISKIYVSPTGPHWFKELVEQTVQRYGFSTLVQQSDLNASPIF